VSSVSSVSSVLMDLLSLSDPTLLRLLSSHVERKGKLLYRVLTQNRLHSLKILYNLPIVVAL
jgi:hypothetical protein